MIHVTDRPHVHVLLVTFELLASHVYFSFLVLPSGLALLSPAALRDSLDHLLGSGLESSKLHRVNRATLGQ